MCSWGFNDICMLNARDSASSAWRGCPVQVEGTEAPLPGRDDLFGNRMVGPPGVR